MKFSNKIYSTLPANNQNQAQEDFVSQSTHLMLHRMSAKQNVQASKISAKSIIREQSSKLAEAKMSHTRLLISPKSSIVFSYCFILILVFILAGAQALHFYDDGTSNNRPFGLPILPQGPFVAMPAIFNQAQQNFHHHQQPMTSLNQLLTPSTGSSQAPSLPLPTASPLLAPPALPAKEPAENSEPQRLASEAVEAQVESRDSGSARASSVEQAHASASNGSGPSPAGRILDAAVEAAASAVAEKFAPVKLPVSNTSGSAESSAQKLGSLSLQLLKPRKQSDISSSSNKQSASSAEQQIINQHARIHPISSNSYHQRLLPTKHRDNKLVAALLDSTGATSNGRNSLLLSALFGNLKDTGISSRSSIVKAISDNKLARTLSNFGKTLSGNKYVAGAAAATLLAALSLTAGKFMSPYLLAGSYSKMSDPMLSSASSIVNPSSMVNFIGTDRTSFMHPPSETLLSASSSPQTTAFFRAPLGPQMHQTSQHYVGSPFEATVSLQPMDLANSFGEQPFAVSGAGLPVSSQSFEQPIYLTYKPTGKSSSSPASLDLQDSTNGHYANFYAQQSGEPPQVSLGPQLVAYSSLGGLQQQQQQQSMELAPKERRFGASQQSNDQTSEQIVASTSLSEPISVGSHFRPTLSAGSGGGRRSGAVALKLDEVTRAKLQQQLLVQDGGEQSSMGGQQKAARVSEPTSAKLMDSSAWLPAATGDQPGASFHLIRAKSSLDHKPSGPWRAPNELADQWTSRPLGHSVVMANGSPEALAELPPPAPSRISRAPSQSSVKQQVGLTNYSAAGVKLTVDALRHSESQPKQFHYHLNHQRDDHPDKDSNNNVIKLIEAESSGASEQLRMAPASLHYASELMLAKSELEHNDDGMTGEESQQKQQQVVGPSASLATATAAATITSTSTSTTASPSSPPTEAPSAAKPNDSDDEAPRAYKGLSAGSIVI